MIATLLLVFVSLSAGLCMGVVLCSIFAVGSMADDMKERP